MKKAVIILFAFSGAMALLSLAGCKKVLDYVKQHPNGVADDCKITQLTDVWYNDDVQDIVYDTSDFVYNNYGDLLRINRRSQTNSGYVPISFDQAFVYDNKHRLIAFLEDILPSPNHDFNNAFLWHTYTYVGNSKVIDSLFEYASGDYTVSFRPTFPNSIHVKRLTLDSWGRVIKEINDDNGIETIYNYDTNGNLVIPGVNYSSKTNIRQTTKVWMLIDRNYSINQPQGQVAQYNSNNLPVKFNSNFGLYIGRYNYGASAMITYSCK